MPANLQNKSDEELQETLHTATKQFADAQEKYRATALDIQDELSRRAAVKKLGSLSPEERQLVAAALKEENDGE